ncbi:MAG: DNA polymerase III subunit alpha, partial [Bacteroides sp.]
MRVVSVQSRQSEYPIKVSDAYVGDGYLQGVGGQLADVDIDFQSDKRQEVKEYLERRYNANGKQRVFSAGTLTTLKLKAVLKDVSRVHKVPLSIVNYITVIFEDDKMGWTELFQLAAINKKVNKFIQDYPQVIEDIRGLMEQPRSASVHASAILITPETKDGEQMECFCYTPIKRVDDMLVSEFDGYSLDEVGLLKNDCLGIKELSKIQSTINECNRVYGTKISFEEIVKSELDDAKAYKILSNGFSQNVFQFSGRGMTKFLMDMRPDCIGDLIAAAALYRPAPIEAGSTEKYLVYKRGEVAPVYLWGTYEALKDTFSVLSFQEQISQLVREVGGFSLGDGVNLLKLISKKRIDKIHAMKERFMQGAKERGCPKEDAVKIWDMIEMSGSYLLNRAHATAYAITAYVGAYLKA